MSNKLFDHLNIFHDLSNEIQKKENGISERIDPKELLKRLDISLEKEGVHDSKLITSLKDIISHTPKTSSSLFFNQLFGGIDNRAALGDLLAVLLNNSMSTYKIAGPMVELEKEIIRKVSDLISYPKTAGGTFPTGGSMSNFMALIIAKDKKYPNTKDQGITDKFVCYSSNCSHYSIGKNAAFAGIGKNNVRYIATNSKGEMIPEKLIFAIEKDLKEGYLPIFVNATAGTTVMGAIDPISEIGTICKRYDVWMHIDGAYLGTVIFSEKYKRLIAGIEKSNSFCFNAHKTLGTPLSTSVLIVKDALDLFTSFNHAAGYLYQTNTHEYNLGQTSFECGRRNNSLKFWTLWKSVGTKGLGEMIDHNYYLSNIAHEYLKNNPHYQVYSDKNSLSICFNYKDLDPIKLCTQLYEKNRLMVGYGEHHHQKFIRLVSINRNNKEEDILNFFKVLEEFADQQ